MSNLTVLQRNTLLGFSDDAGTLYLRLQDKGLSELDAFKAADAWQERIEPILAVARVQPDVSEFIRTRYLHYTMSRSA